MAVSKIDYQSLQQELETIMAKLADTDGDVDQAIKYYERGMAVVAQLGDYLQAAQNKIHKVKAKFDAN